jgi:hypothetical protein
VETNDYPLGMCEGTCKQDQDCQKGLICQVVFPEQMVTGCQHCKEEDMEDNMTGDNNDYFFPGFLPDDSNNETGLFNQTNNNETDSPFMLPEMPPFNNSSNNNNNETGFNFTNDVFVPHNNSNIETEGESTISIGNETASTSELPDTHYTLNGGRKLQYYYVEEETEPPTPSWNRTVDDVDWSQPPKDDNNYNDEDTVMLSRGPTSSLTRPPEPGDSAVEQDYIRYYCVPAPEKADDSETIATDPGLGDFTGSRVDGEGEESSAAVLLPNGCCCIRLSGMLLAAILMALWAW